MEKKVQEIHDQTVVMLGDQLVAMQGDQIVKMDEDQADWLDELIVAAMVDLTVGRKDENDGFAAGQDVVE